MLEKIKKEVLSTELLKKYGKVVEIQKIKIGDVIVTRVIR